MGEVQRILAAGSARLGSAAESRILLAQAVGVEPTALPLLPGVPPEAEAAFTNLLARREAGEPVQYLTGQAWFRTISVSVGPGVFIPRPETEVMTGWAIEWLRGQPGAPLVVELCAGSGAISLAINTEVPGCRQFAVEVSPVAARYAEANLAGTGVDLRLGDMADSFPELDGQVDLVIANPPYIPLEAWDQVAPDVREHEPDLALFSGPDGLAAMRQVAGVAARLLRPGGAVCVEHAESQSDAVVELFTRAGTFHRVSDHLDLTGRPRFATGVRVGKLAG